MLSFLGGVLFKQLPPQLVKVSAGLHLRSVRNTSNHIAHVQGRMPAFMPIVAIL